jgi:hypothetical protein
VEGNILTVFIVPGTMLGRNLKSAYQMKTEARECIITKKLINTHKTLIREILIKFT